MRTGWIAKDIYFEGELYEKRGTLIEFDESNADETGLSAWVPSEDRATWIHLDEISFVAPELSEVHDSIFKRSVESESHG